MNQNDLKFTKDEAQRILLKYPKLQFRGYFGKFHIVIMTTVLIAIATV